MPHTATTFTLFFPGLAHSCKQSAYGSCYKIVRFSIQIEKWCRVLCQEWRLSFKITLERRQNEEIYHTASDQKFPRVFQLRTRHIGEPYRWLYDTYDTDSLCIWPIQITCIRAPFHKEFFQRQNGFWAPKWVFSDKNLVNGFQRQDSRFIKIDAEKFWNNYNFSATIWLIFCRS